MLLFKIAEPTEIPDPIPPGLDFEVDEGETRIRLAGCKERGQCFHLPVGESLGKYIAKAKEEASWLSETNGSSEFMPVLEQGKIVHVKDGLCLVRECEPIDLRIDRRLRPPCVACIHLVTEAGAGGKLRLTANSHDEVIEEVKQGRYNYQKVEYRWKPFPSVGVEVLNPHQVDITPEGFVHWRLEWDVEDAPSLLLSMQPRSSFRIWRTGQLEGAPSMFIVSWSGTELRTVVPRRDRQ